MKNKCKYIDMAYLSKPLLNFLSPEEYHVVNGCHGLYFNERKWNDQRVVIHGRSREWKASTT